MIRLFIQQTYWVHLIVDVLGFILGAENTNIKKLQ